jgi:hypothetical protein
VSLPAAILDAVASIWSSTWEGVYAVAVVMAIVGLLGWLFRLLRGEASLHDENERLKPLAVVAPLLAGLVLVGAIAELAG